DISQIDVVPTGYSTSVLSSDGEEITKLVGSGANRIYVTLDEIPFYMQKAFIAVEDMRFYEHNGIDPQGIVRAFVSGLKNGKFNEGASTITQQLIKNNVLTTWTGETTFIERLQRKIQEQYLALKLEEQVNDKDWILENYLNTINLGANTLGVQAAANKYFGKEVSELTLSEAAVIAGITKNPYGYNPISFPKKNAERREKVLDDMLEQNYITQRQYDEAMADDVYERIASYNETTTASVNSYFVDALIEDVVKDLVEHKGYTETDAYKALYQGGLTIVSTQDLAMQAICDEEANDLSNYETKPEYSFNLSFQVKKADGKTKNYSHQTMLSYYKKKTGNQDFSINYSNEDACYEAIRKYEQDVLEPGDTIIENSESIYITLQPQLALTVIDQYTGEVKALVGGRGDKVGNRTWNRATDTLRQPGSTFKIIGCYAPALDAGGYTLASTQDDAPFSAGGKSYKNASSGRYYGLTTLREAITKSHNITTVKTLQQMGASLGYEYALKFGFTTLSESDINLSLSLGGLTHGVSNLELTAAYAAIANSGEYIEPSFYSVVYDHNGDVLLDNKTTKERHTVIKETTAWLLTDAMKDVMTSGTGTKAYFGSSMAQAGKSGTTTSTRDSLFAGYTPYYTCVIWGGCDDNSKQTSKETAYTKNVYREVMKRIHSGLEYKDFTRPEGITTASVCNKSGCKPLQGTCSHALGGSTVYTEYFALGTVPAETCDNHITLNICQETGMIANAHCPAEQVVQKVYIYGADPNTSDRDIIATDSFINNICTHTEVIIPEIPEIPEIPGIDDGSTPDNNTNITPPIDTTPPTDTPNNDTNHNNGTNNDHNNDTNHNDNHTNGGGENTPTTDEDTRTSTDNHDSFFDRFFGHD
ncbi:MAG: transglycosylase domain-containing protein, partial [Lachnospiraceae bacterium]|nr:transglycosylase domain-containing protein [Lachnospiraceae bacterium]